ncbi:MAG: hypothetical protein BGO04_15025 [Microbacterium sp. 70-38]|nr:MAG: hypothetical protein BGO04_15025 [Microbacterium sp. 70-38]
MRRIDDLSNLDGQGYFEREPLSTLAIDDAAIYPLQVSTAPHFAILSSIDHLRTIADIVRSGTLPMTAVGTLLRSALETSCSAIYFLAPQSRADRVLRALRDEYFQIADAERMTADFDPDLTVNREGKEEMLGRALQGFSAAGSWANVTGGRPASITTKIQFACPVVEAHSLRGRAEFAVRGLWRGLSGITHGRQYAALAILDREELGYDESTGVVQTHMTFGVRSLVSCLAIVLDVVETAQKLWGQRSRRFTNLPEDAELVAVLRVDGRL